ncbi:MAG: hypothetical protein BWY86_01033 [Candidatus Aminicenantes bacterium ADurb.Bin508]|nr:MAG: hypothetical protein BWY86_01033 [Candidatus Aminicenantes bacterium ADurb.Bin508]
MSERWSIFRPSACSGDIEEIVPTMRPLWVISRSCRWGEEAGVMGLARPKSRIFTVPSGVTRMLEPLISLWMIPFEWAASNPAMI